MKQSLELERPDLLILIDFPDFNLRLAKFAHQRGIPVLYYISPQVWAWRPGRVKLIARWVKKMVVFFPFEVPIYKAAGVDVEWVGHPLLDVVKPALPKEETRFNNSASTPQSRSSACFPEAAHRNWKDLSLSFSTAPICFNRRSRIFSLSFLSLRVSRKQACRAG